MSLEKALEANTAAVLALTEMLNTDMAALASFLKGQQPTPKKPEPAAKPSKATAVKSAETPASTTPAQPAATSTSLSYDDIKTPFLELAKRDLAAAQALIAEFGFKTLKDAKPEQYAEILRALTPDSEEGMA